MERVVSKSKFKPRALEFFRQVEESGDELVITDQGRPVVKIVPYRTPPTGKPRTLRGSVRRYERPLDPVADTDWSALR